MKTVCADVYGYYMMDVFDRVRPPVGRRGRSSSFSDSPSPRKVLLHLNFNLFIYFETTD